MLQRVSEFSSFSKQKLLHCTTFSLFIHPVITSELFPSVGHVNYTAMNMVV